ncbi:MAG: hypothetical protein Q7R52_02020 [archaeon]|nr:hypothetical protein [archaeon]
MRDNEHMLLMVNYIKKNLTKGYTLESLKWSLINQGHSRGQVDRAIALVHKELSEQAPRLETPKENPVVEVQEEPKKKSFWKRLFGGSD